MRRNSTACGFVQPGDGNASRPHQALARHGGLKPKLVCVHAVEHLHIVNTFIADTIEALGRGEVPVRAANTAAVKPETSADRSACALLEISCADVAKAARSISDLRTPIRHPHPWFGPLDAAAWHFMAGFHMKLHRRQIIAILQPL